MGRMDLLGRQLIFATKFSLNGIEELLDWIKPWRVRCIQQDACLHFASGLVYDGDFMNSCIVHKDHDLLICR